MKTEAPSTIVILVHGTWGKNSSFGFPDKSNLAKAIRDCFGADIPIERFAWSGRNSQHQRSKAAAELAERLRKMLADKREVRIILACHSHAGNVAQKACEGLGGDIRIISLGTPYFQLIRTTRILEVKALVLLCISIVLGFLSWVSIFVAGYFEFTTFLLLTIVHCIAYLTILRRAPWDTPEFPGMDAIHKRYAGFYAKMPFERPTFAIYTHRDEVAGFVWFWDWICYGISFVVTIPLLWFTMPPTWSWIASFANSHVIEGPGNIGSDPGMFLLVIPELLMTLIMVIGGLLAVGLATIAASFLVSSVCAVFIKWVSRFPVSGVEPLGIPLGFNVIVRYLPVGSHVKHMQLPYFKWWKAPLWPLVHSKLYDDPNILREICDWIAKAD